MNGKCGKCKVYEAMYCKHCYFINGKMEKTHSQRVKDGIQKKKGMKFEKPESGEWVQPKIKGYLMKCCDCGLVHRMDFRIVKYANGKRSKIQFRVFRVSKKKNKLLR